MRRITIKDLARILNISVSTVSRALSDHPDISDQTKQKVLAAAKEFNYTTNLHAKFFRKQHSRLIALILPEFNMFFSPSLIKGINEIISSSKYSLITFITNDEFETEEKMVKQCLSWAVEGVLISLSRQTENLDHLKILEESDVKCVLLDKTVHNDTFPAVTIDSELASYNAISHLIENGHKNILGIFGNPNFSISKDRMSGYYRALKDHGIPVINENVLSLSQSTDLDFVLPSILKFNLDITAIFTMSDELLAKTYFHLNSANKSIPDQLSIVSISDGEFPYLAYPQTTYVRDSGKKMGKVASKLLISILEDDIIPKLEYVVNTKIISLDSVKSIAI